MHINRSNANICVERLSLRRICNHTIPVRVQSTWKNWGLLSTTVRTAEVYGRCSDKDGNYQVWHEEDHHNQVFLCDLINCDADLSFSVRIRKMLKVGNDRCLRHEGDFKRHLAEKWYTHGFLGTVQALNETYLRLDIEFERRRFRTFCELAVAFRGFQQQTYQLHFRPMYE